MELENSIINKLVQTNNLRGIKDRLGIKKIVC